MNSIKRTFWTAAGLLGLVAIFALPAAADQQILDDLIVDGSACVGLDCVNGESFGFDTLRLKENNLRINFADTSTSASFPSNDWRITINDSSNGGGNYFAVEDSDRGRQPFRIEGGAPANSLYVEDSGRVGFGTSTPVVDLHVKSGNTPTLRLDQDGSSGFAAQTWDVAGNEANFFIRDATNGSTLAFRIKPGAASQSIYIGTSSEGIGIRGNPAADTPLKIYGGTTNTSPDLHVFQATEVPLLQVESGGAKNTRIAVKNSLSSWDVRNNTVGQFSVVLAGSADAALVIEDIIGDEDVTIQNDLTVLGTIFGTVSSSRALKTGIEPVDSRQVLAKVAEMPMAMWNYNLGNRHDRERHLGPMAEDFHAAFGLGRDDKSISLVDYSGVALAAIQGLDQEKDEEIARLEAQNAALAERLSRLEAVILELAAADR